MPQQAVEPTHDAAVLPLLAMTENTSGEGGAKPFALIEPLVVYQCVSRDFIMEAEEHLTELPKRNPQLAKLLAEARAGMAEYLAAIGQEREKKRKEKKNTQ